MKINPETMGSWNLLEILERVNWPDFPESVEPQKKVAPDEKSIGVVASLVARNLYMVGEMIGRPVAGLSLPRAVTHHRGVALNELFWLNVIEEHPVVAQTGAELRQGWVIVAPSEKPEWAVEATFSPDDSILRTCSSRISEIFNGEVIEVSGEEILTPRKAGEGLLYVVEDERIRSLRLLRCQLKAEERQRTPAGLDVDDSESLKAWSEHVPPISVKKTLALINEYRQALNRLDMIFFAAVRDVMPNGHAAAQLAMRKGWEIIETEPSRIVSTQVMVIPIGRGGQLDLGGFDDSDLFAPFLREQGKR